MRQSGQEDHVQKITRDNKKKQKHYQGNMKEWPRRKEQYDKGEQEENNTNPLNMNPLNTLKPPAPHQLIAQRR